jgi:hypothetical protein
MIETLIWALDLVAVAYLCLWALRTDKAETEKKPPQQGSKNA